MFKNVFFKRLQAPCETPSTPLYACYRSAALAKLFFGFPPDSGFPARLTWLLQRL